MYAALPLAALGASVLGGNEIYALQASEAPQVLVIISDHGSGTAEFGAALQTHPCMIDLGEPFAFKKTVWATNAVAECTGNMATDMTTTVFNAITGELVKGSNPVLMDRIAAQKTHFSSSCHRLSLPTNQLRPSTLMTMKLRNCGLSQQRASDGGVKTG
jgi:hypothetical protein